MAVFGAPTALEDHAFRACLAALGIQEEATRLASDVQDRDGMEFRLRIGLNSGQDAITHLRSVLGDQTYESLTRKGETMTTAEMATYAYDQIDQARTELEHLG
jgi:class 3 adenylate cyclase